MIRKIKNGVVIEALDIFETTNDIKKQAEIGKNNDIIVYQRTKVTYTDWTLRWVGNIPTRVNNQSNSISVSAQATRNKITKNAISTVVTTETLPAEVIIKNFVEFATIDPETLNMTIDVNPDYEERQIIITPQFFYKGFKYVDDELVLTITQAKAEFSFVEASLYMSNYVEPKAINPITINNSNVFDYTGGYVTLYSSANDYISYFVWDYLTSSSLEFTINGLTFYVYYNEKGIDEQLSSIRVDPITEQIDFGYKSSKEVLIYYDGESVAKCEFLFAKNNLSSQNYMNFSNKNLIFGNSEKNIAILSQSQPNIEYTLDTVNIKQSNYIPAQGLKLNYETILDYTDFTLTYKDNDNNKYVFTNKDLIAEELANDIKIKIKNTENYIIVTFYKNNKNLNNINIKSLGTTIYNNILTTNISLNYNNILLFEYLQDKNEYTTYPIKINLGCNVIDPIEYKDVNLATYNTKDIFYVKNIVLLDIYDSKESSEEYISTDIESYKGSWSSSFVSVTPNITVNHDTEEKTYNINDVTYTLFKSNVLGNSIQETINTKFILKGFTGYKKLAIYPNFEIKSEWMNPNTKLTIETFYDDALVDINSLILSSKLVSKPYYFKQNKIYESTNYLDPLKFKLTMKYNGGIILSTNDIPIFCGWSDNLSNYSTYISNYSGRNAYFYNLETEELELFIYFSGLPDKIMYEENLYINVVYSNSSNMLQLYNDTIPNSYILQIIVNGTILDNIQNSIKIEPGTHNVKILLNKYYRDLSTIPGKLFKDCEDLVTIKIPETYYKWETAGRVFLNCINLNHVDLNNKFTEIEQYAFYGCTNLNYISSLYNCYDNIQRIGRYAFYQCKSLDEVSLTMHDLTNIEEYAFYNSGLKNITLGDQLKNIGNKAFNDNVLLENIFIGKLSIDDTLLKGCTNILTLSINSEIIDSSIFSNFNSLINVYFLDNVKEIRNHAFYKCGDLIHIEIPDTVEKLEEYAFANCQSLASVSIGKFNNGNGIIGTTVFQNDYNITDLYINSKEVGDSAFISAKKLSNLEFGDNTDIIDCSAFAYSGINSKKMNFSTNNVSIIKDNAFLNCSKIQSIDLPNVVSLGKYAFSSNINLQNVSIGNKCTDIGDYCFYGDINLTNVDSLSSVANIGTAAFSAKHLYNLEWLGILTLVSVGSLDNAKYIGDYAFNKAQNLTSITLKSSALNNSIFIGKSAFLDCLKLKGDIYLKSLENIYDHAFYGCINIEKIRLGKNAKNPDSFIHSDDTLNKNRLIFNNCPSCIEMSVDPNNMYYTSLDNNGNEVNCIMNKDRTIIYYGCNTTKIISSIVTLDYQSLYMNLSKKYNSIVFENNSSLKTIGNYAFYNNDIDNIIIPKSANIIGSYAYANCRNIINIFDETLNIYNLNNVSIIKNNAFENCKSLCTSLKLDNIVIIENRSFYDCNSLISIHFGPKLSLISQKMNKLEYIHPFVHCNNLTTITIDSNSSLYKSELNCLLSLNGEILYIGCKGSTHIPESINTIYPYAFSENLLDNNSIYISNANIIESNAFYNCEGLTTIILNNIKYLNNNSFYNCKSLNNIQLNIVEFPKIFGTNKLAPKGKIYIPSELINLSSNDYIKFKENISSYIGYEVGDPKTDLDWTIESL